MVDEYSVLLAVPVGQENAIGVSEIEEVVGVWASKLVRRCLSELVATGRVNSIIVRGRRRHETTVYFRPRS
jgi:hypothetical protein